MKYCKGCKEIKPLDTMIRNHKMSDGYTNFCKTCTKEKHALKEYKIRARKYDAIRSKTEKRKALSIRVCKDYRLQYPERYSATTQVNNAIRKGALSREPCFICGETKSHAHHSDYSRP